MITAAFSSNAIVVPSGLHARLPPPVLFVGGEWLAPAEIEPSVHVDPATGEAWHRGNVLGHMSEMLDYWTGQIEAVIKGSSTMGRDEKGAASRRQGIEHGNALSEAELRRAIDQKLGRVLVLLAAMTPEDLERTVDFHNREGNRTARVGELVQNVEYRGQPIFGGASGLFLPIYAVDNRGLYFFYLMAVAAAISEPRVVRRSRSFAIARSTIASSDRGSPRRIRLGAGGSTVAISWITAIAVGPSKGRRPVRAS